jgi:prepilin-type N-terminal cleavage/methylation domain-containing protein
MGRSRAIRRQGFTLLEVLLASALAVILMAALYVALDVQLRLAAAGRDAIEESRVARAIVLRFDNDLAASVGPVAPKTGNTGSGASAGSGTGMGTGGGTGMGTGTGGTGTGGTGAAPMEEGDAVVEMTTTTDAIPFQAGVVGESDRLTIFVARVAGRGKVADESPDAPSPADIQRVTYWMSDGGLCRQELPWLTSDAIRTTVDPHMEDGKEERDYVIADEVTRVQFEYWDGSAWTETWDGRQTNSDGQTLKGPPMAIRVHFWLRVPGPEGDTIEKEIRHTIAVRGAPGPATNETTTQQQP